MLAFFQGTSGKLSMMRLLCFISALGSLLLIAFHPDQATPLCGVTAMALAGKWLQRGSENG